MVYPAQLAGRLGLVAGFTQFIHAIFFRANLVAAAGLFLSSSALSPAGPGHTHADLHRSVR